MYKTNEMHVVVKLYDIQFNNIHFVDVSTVDVLIFHAD